MKRKITYCLFLLFFSACSLRAQNQWNLKLIQVDSNALPKKMQIKEGYKSSLEAEEAINTLVSDLRKSGYVTASLDSLNCDTLSCEAYLFLGEKYIVSALENGNIEKTAWQALGISKIKGNNNVNLMQRAEKKLLKYFENNGYPYATIWLDSVSIQGNQVSAKVYAAPNDLITIDSVVIHGNTKTKSKFLQRYLGIQVGDVYSQQKMNSISNKLRQLPYLLESKPSELYFTEGKATLHVFMDKQKSNQFNLVLGVLPNDQLTDSKVTITGDGRLHLLNSFGVGEEIFAEFKQLKPRTQNLDIEFAYPYLLNSPIGTYGSFNLYKNDSLFIEINTELGVIYQFGGFNRLKLFYSNNTSNILNADTNAIKASGNLPSTLDIRNNSYGAAIELQQLDYVLNPRKGFQFMLKSQVGSNRIRVNQSIATLTGFDGESLANRYEEIDLKKINYTIGFHLSQFIPIRKRSTFLFRNVTETFIAKDVLNNEKFRIGGYKLLRGFDEEAIFTPYYSIFTSEFRYLLSKNSYFNIFADVALVENELKGAGSVDVPIGFGAGVALETRGGIFSLSYALGRNLDNKIQFRNGKIHFGFVSLF